MLLVFMYHQIFCPSETDNLPPPAMPATPSCRRGLVDVRTPHDDPYCRRGLLDVSGTPHEVGLFEQHIAHLKKHYPIVLPGDTLEPKKLSICLVFDDAYYDFYHTVFPLLKAYDLKAVLAIPTGFIQAESHLDAGERLSVPYPQGLEPNVNQTRGALCTWAEIKEMVDSKVVIPASHSHTHANLTDPDTDLEQELRGSKKVLEEKLGVSINTFVFPYGAMNQKALEVAAKYYCYNLRIGSALNRNWKARKGLVYRVDADPFWQQGKALSPQVLKKLKMKYFLNKIRMK